LAATLPFRFLPTHTTTAPHAVHGACITRMQQRLGQEVAGAGAGTGTGAGAGAGKATGTEATGTEGRGRTHQLVNKDA